MLVPLLAFPPVFFTLGHWAERVPDRRAVRGGDAAGGSAPGARPACCSGALCYKPHFGLLVPVALVAAGRWRAFLAPRRPCWTGRAVSAGVRLGHLACVLRRRWPARDAIYETGVAHPAMASPFGAVLALGGSPGLWLTATGGDGDHGRDGVRGLAPGREPAGARRDAAGGDAARGAGGAVLRPDAVGGGAGVAGAMGT